MLTMEQLAAITSHHAANLLTMQRNATTQSAETQMSPQC